MSFFDDFDAARHEFEYADAADTRRLVMQGGLVATFYLDEAASRRTAVAEVLRRYTARYGQHLRGGYVGDANRPWTPGLLRVAPQAVESSMAAEFQFSSSPSFEHVGDYMIESLIVAGWYEQVHRSLSWVTFHLPVDELRGGGIATLQDFLIDCCNLLQPLHGSFGLGFQLCASSEDWQHLEYEQALRFNGLVPGGARSAREEYRAGFKTVSWYTILDRQWVQRLGGARRIADALGDDRIELLFYDDGIVVKAGAWPALGWVEQDPHPELYAKVDRVLRGVRASDAESFHHGSYVDAPRFDKHSSNRWIRRFDEAVLPPAVETLPASPAALRKSPPEPVDLLCFEDDPCPRTGWWVVPGFPRSRRRFNAGDTMPMLDAEHDPTIWEWDGPP